MKRKEPEARCGRSGSANCLYWYSLLRHRFVAIAFARYWRSSLQRALILDRRRKLQGLRIVVAGIVVEFETMLRLALINRIIEEEIRQIPMSVDARELVGFGRRKNGSLDDVRRHEQHQIVLRHVLQVVLEGPSEHRSLTYPWHLAFRIAGIDRAQATKNHRILVANDHVRL